MRDSKIIESLHSKAYFASVDAGYSNAVFPTAEEIDEHGNRILRLARRGKITRDMTDEEVYDLVIPSGLIALLVQMFVRTIAKEALLWIIRNIRPLIWNDTSVA